MINEINRYTKSIRRKFVLQQENRILCSIFYVLSQENEKYALLSSQSNCSYFWVLMITNFISMTHRENADNAVEKFSKVSYKIN